MNKKINCFLVNNLFYIILNKEKINEIKEINIVYQDKKIYILIKTNENKYKILLNKYLEKINNVDINNKIIKNNFKKIDIKDIIIFITDINEFRKKEKGLVVELPLNEYL